MNHHPHGHTHLIHLPKIALTKIYKMKVASLVPSVTDTWVFCRPASTIAGRTLFRIPVFSFIEGLVPVDDVVDHIFLDEH